MEEIIDKLLGDFNFPLMFVINIAAYAAIKFLDEINGVKVPSTWQKRLIFVILAIVIAHFYVKSGNTTPIVALNSIILAPISWSWIFRPILDKLGCGYKQKGF